MKAPKNTESSVKVVLERLAEAYAKRDIGLLRSVFASDSDVLLYGTGADEKRVGFSEIQQQAERDWSQTDAVEVSYGWTSISSTGSVAWVASDAAFKFKADSRDLVLPARLTVVLEKQGEQWLIVHMHCSL